MLRKYVIWYMQTTAEMMLFHINVYGSAVFYPNIYFVRKIHTRTQIATCLLHINYHYNLTVIKTRYLVSKI